MQDMIIGKDIRKQFGNEKEKQTVLDGVSLEIKRGEFVSIMGPSGSGKSTLLYSLSGMEPIDEGEVLFDGKQISQLSEKESSKLRREKMGFIFQQPGLLANLNIFDNITLTAIHSQKKLYSKIKEQAVKLMHQTGIDGLEERRITEVSGGQLQRAGICRALMNEPDVLFADEPTGALNSKTSEEIMEILKQIHTGGTTIVLVTHDAKVAASSDRVIFLLDGKISTELDMSEITSIEKRKGQIMETMEKVGI